MKKVISTRKGGWTQTYTGLQFWGMDARPEDIEIADIAHSLANVNRYNGHTPVPYSVAQHSVYVSMECDPEDDFDGLMHDATEGYIGDMISPIKKFLPEFRTVEDNLFAVMSRKFWLNPIIPESVKRADLTVLAAESRDLFPKKPADWGLPYPPVERKIRPVAWKTAERMFLKRFNDLWQPHANKVAAQLKPNLNSSEYKLLLTELSDIGYDAKVAYEKLS